GQRQPVSRRACPAHPGCQNVARTRQVSWLAARLESSGLPEASRLSDERDGSVAAYSCGGSFGFAASPRTEFPFHRTRVRTAAPQDIGSGERILSTNCGLALRRFAIGRLDRGVDSGRGRRSALRCEIAELLCERGSNCRLRRVHRLTLALCGARLRLHGRQILAIARE